MRRDRPLAGRRIVVTRARAQAAELSGSLEALGASVVVFPSIEIAPIEAPEVDAALMQIPEYDWVLLTSTNAVEIVFDRLDALGFGAAHFGSCAIGVVGAPTAERVRERGATVSFVPDEFVAEALVEGLVKTKIDGKRILLLRAKVARATLPEQLRAAGALVDDVAIYETRLPTIDDDMRREVVGDDIDCVTFTSQSSVRNVVTALGALPPERIRIACIGPVTAAAACEAGLRVDILAETYSIEGLVTALISHLGVGEEDDPA